MPLPPALLARLKKRGIVTNNVVVAGPQEPHEEVIAEDYDEPEKSDEEEDAPKSVEEPKYELLDDGETAPGCPNKYNIFHDCTTFCRDKWGSGNELSPELERKYQRLLKRYPLPDGWQDVWEPGVGCFYFWNTDTEEVSWLPPLHPDAKVSVSAAKMKSLLREDGSGSSGSGSDEEEEESDSDETDSDDTDSSIEAKEEKIVEPVRKKFKPVNTDRPMNFDNKRSRGRPRRNDLDPMDPAAYSESCPRGKWGDGLDSKADKSGNGDEVN